MFYETKDHHGLKHNPFKSLVVPRPIGWVSSMAADGTVNLAPYSFFNAMAADPPAVALGCNGLHVEGGAKDTVVNIETTGEFVVNIATWDLREQMNLTSASVPRSIDEMREAGLEPAPCRLIKPPRVAADLLYPPVGASRSTIGLDEGDLTPPGAAPPLDLDGPLHPSVRG